MTPFEVSWDELDTEAVARFLQGVGRDDEAITWEAKGDDPRGVLQPDSVEEAVAGMANGYYVGYVVIGANWRGGAWHLAGLAQPKGVELATWLDQVVDRIRPRPITEIKPLVGKIGPGAVIRVQPIAVGPAITSKGRLLIRTAKRTVPVIDPGEVRRLFDRGEHALARAREHAIYAANRARTMPFESPYSPSLSVGLASAGRVADTGLAIYRRSFLDWLREEYLGWDGDAQRGDLQSRLPPDRVTFWNPADRGSQAGVMASGAVYLTIWRAADRDVGLDVAISGELQRMWGFAARTVSRLGGHGPTLLFGQFGYGTGAVAALRWRTERPEPLDTEVEAALRYLQRIRGDPAVFEPDESSGSGVSWQ
jgi:hypothetical protein